MPTQPAQPVAEAPVAAQPVAEPVSQPAVKPVAEPVVETAQARPAAQPAVTEAAPVAAVAEPQPVRTNGASSRGQSAEALTTMLASAGLVWVNTDTDKLRAAQEAASQAVKPARVPRERKALPPVDATPMQQVETAKHQ
jgi:ribonuclease E